MKTKNNMRGITRLAGIALFLCLVLTLFACTGGNQVNKNDEKVKKYIKDLDHKDSSVQIRAAIELGRLKNKGANRRTEGDRQESFPPFFRGIFKKVFSIVSR